MFDMILDMLVVICTYSQVGSGITRLGAGEFLSPAYKVPLLP